MTAGPPDGAPPRRRPLVAGNWKLHCTVDESIALVRALADGLAARPALSQRTDVVVAPTFLALHACATVLDGSPVAVGAQDTHWEPKGAFTREVSPPLLRAAGCRYGIVGHSERRQLFQETDDDVRRKREALVGEGLEPIVCIGETLEEREAGRTEAVVLGQLRAALDGATVPADGGAVPFVIAYEPVWAIGTGRSAAPADAQAVHQAIRQALGELFGDQAAGSTRILYGGSVKPTNCPELFAQPDIDGALVGGASLDAGSFLAIVEAAAAQAVDAAPTPG